MKNHLYKDRKYNVVPYDPQWPSQFLEYTKKIRAVFGDLPIKHIGSTSVPGMSGKPCIDVLVLVENLEIVNTPHIHQMEQAGFEYAGEFVMPNSRLFRVIKDNTLLANIHFFPSQHIHVKEMLDLRDYLRSHPKEVEAYSSIKNDLNKKYSNDYASYRKHKDEYMNGLKERIVQNTPIT